MGVVGIASTRRLLGYGSVRDILGPAGFQFPRGGGTGPGFPFLVKGITPIFEKVVKGCPDG